MTTTHRMIFIGTAILTLNLLMCRAETGLSLNDDAVCTYAKDLLNQLSLNETLENKTERIKDKWNLNDAELQHFPKVCQTVFLHALGNSSAEQVITAACRWLYNNSSADKCKEEVYYYCFAANTEKWRNFRNEFDPAFNCSN